MENKPTCPYCGSPMYKRIIPFVDGAWGGKYDCGNSKCGISSPYVESYNQNECRKLAYEAALKRPLQKPIPPLEIFQNHYQIPCWLERRGEIRISPEVLDKDSVGYFGKIDSRIWIDYKKMKPEEYGKTWRCWRTRPTNEELEAAAWEE